MLCLFLMCYHELLCDSYLQRWPPIISSLLVHTCFSLPPDVELVCPFLEPGCLALTYRMPWESCASSGRKRPSTFSFLPLGTQTPHCEQLMQHGDSTWRTEALWVMAPADHPANSHGTFSAGEGAGPVKSSDIQPL